MAVSYPILLDFPDHFETRRLLIRAPRAGDGAAVSAAIRESHASLQDWLTWARKARTAREVEIEIREAALKFQAREDLRLHIYRKSDGEFVGSSGLHHPNWSVPSFKIGYWLRDSMTGQGYMTEAVRGITAFAFETLGAQRLSIRCDAHNTRSAAVACRAGYILEGWLHNCQRDINGNLTDMLFFSRLPKDSEIEWEGDAVIYDESIYKIDIPPRKVKSPVPPHIRAGEISERPPV